MFGYRSRIYLDMKEYLMDTKRISHGYLTGYLLDIKGYCLDMCGYPDLTQACHCCCCSDLTRELQHVIVCPYLNVMVKRSGHGPSRPTT